MALGSPTLPSFLIDRRKEFRKTCSGQTFFADEIYQRFDEADVPVSP
jgi:hypothetical protein